jgi:hypothetical protein
LRESYSLLFHPSTKKKKRPKKGFLLELSRNIIDLYMFSPQKFRQKTGQKKGGRKMLLHVFFFLFLLSRTIKKNKDNEE